MIVYVQLLIVALGVGIIGGMLGIGGAIIIIPILAYGFGWAEKVAQGTALAMMLPPVGLLAVWQYHRQGKVMMVAAVLAAVCFLPAAEAGAYLANLLPTGNLVKGFGIFAVVLGIKMLWPQSAGKNLDHR